MHISEQELLPIVSCAIWGSALAGCHIRCLCDNAAIVVMINKHTSKRPVAMHLLRYLFFICGRIWENPAYGIRMRFAQCAFLVAQVEICQSPDFVIYMSNNPSNCCRLLRRLIVLYEGEISLHFDPPSRHSRRTRSPLLWAVIRILYLETARFIDLLYVTHLFSFLGI